MKSVRFAVFFFLTILFPTQIPAQIATKTGNIYGRVLDQIQTALPGVMVTLTSNLVPDQLATSGDNGGFRFTNLPPGTYSIRCTLDGFSEVEQQDLTVKVGGTVELTVVMKPVTAENVTVIAETPLIDTRKTSISSTTNAESMQTIPTGRDPWFIIGLTPGIDSTRLDTMSGSNVQAGFYSRGGNFKNNIWNYDGVTQTDAFGGSSPTYYDFDAFSEIQISTAGNDASIQTGGVAINLVTKRAGNRWSGNGSFYFANQNMQSSNTPDELKKNPPISPFTGLPAVASNRIQEINDYGFDLGGPVVQDRFFLWGAYRHSKIEGFDLFDVIRSTGFNDYNLKANFTWNKENESQAAFFKGLKNAHRFALSSSQMAPEAAWDQSATPGQGIWTATHTWIPNDHMLMNVRYGYIGAGFRLDPVGGADVPMILLSAIPHYENTYRGIKSEQPAHDINMDVDYFKERFFSGDHEFRFGFEYKSTQVHSFSTYGNGVYIYDLYQTTPGGPLTSGYLYAQHAFNYQVHMQRTSVYAADTYRKQRITMNVGARFDYQTGTNEASSVQGVPGYESFVGPFSYSGGNSGIHFANVSPRLGASFDVTGKGTTVIRVNFARYYDALSPDFITFKNPTATYNGAFFSYQNSNNDRTITPDEIVGDPTFYGGWGPSNTFTQTRSVDPNLTSGWTNEFVTGVEHQLTGTVSIAANYIHRKYGNVTSSVDGVPLGVSTADYIPGGIYHKSTVLGDFTIPYFILPFTPQERILTNIHDYSQTYDGLDLTLTKRMSHNFQINGGITIQKQKGHYNGGDSLGFVIKGSPANTIGSTAPFDPTNLPFLQGKPYAYQDDGSLIYPVSDWAIKANCIYQLPWGLTTGAYIRYQQGYPFVLVATVPQTPGEDAPHLILAEPIGSRRYDNVFTLDLHIEKIFLIGASGRIGILADIFNLTNENAVLRRGQRINNSVAFNQIQQVLAPRSLRLGLRISF